VEQIRNSENDPAWMVLDVVPVIPPDLRPLVLLESGNFATSDLNDLYRRIINRNNRLKKLMDLNAPEVIIRNEKRMLQQAVDALFDNGRCRRPVLGSSNRPLKSLTDMIKGKQGRFRENLLGKRVDYSARSVIVVGPELKLNQCGLPKKIALELYQPFIIRKLKEHGLADTIKSAKRMLERRDAEVWDILEQVIYQHPVLLNRAPTLHRMGIQAFEPVLVEGNAIMIHPLVCTGYNADFDGDQMAVHLPLSVEAQAEAHVLMLSTHNIFSPANGKPIMSPSQDIVMGVYFTTHMDGEDKRPAEELPLFRDPHDAILAFDMQRIGLHDRIVVRLRQFEQTVEKENGDIKAMPAHRRIVTTVGRVLFNEMLDTGMPFYNCVLGKKGCSRVIDDVYARLGRPATMKLLDDMKEIGFKPPPCRGCRSPSPTCAFRRRSTTSSTRRRSEGGPRGEGLRRRGIITERERHNQLLDLWAHCREQVTKALVEHAQERPPRSRDAPRSMAIDTDEGTKYLNPVYLMSTRAPAATSARCSSWPACAA
jgi:DNA-directed RNA polymerase subunit beta'